MISVENVLTVSRDEIAEGASPYPIRGYGSRVRTLNGVLSTLYRPLCNRQSVKFKYLEIWDDGHLTHCDSEFCIQSMRACGRAGRGKQAGGRAGRQNGEGGGGGNVSRSSRSAVLRASLYGWSGAELGDCP